MPKQRHLFLYGTLMDPEILALVLGLPVGMGGLAARLTPALLADYRRGYIVGRNFPGLAPERGGETQGLLLRAVSTTEVMRLNAYEGPHYRLAAVDVRCAPLSDARTQAGADVQAYAYVIRPGLSLGEDWHLESWQQHHKPTYMRRWFG